MLSPDKPSNFASFNFKLLHNSLTPILKDGKIWQFMANYGQLREYEASHKCTFLLYPHLLSNCASFELYVDLLTPKITAFGKMVNQSGCGHVVF